jgi:hypothetical protein
MTLKELEERIKEIKEYGEKHNIEDFEVEIFGYTGNGIVKLHIEDRTHNPNFDIGERKVWISAAE